MTEEVERVENSGDQSEGTGRKQSVTDEKRYQQLQDQI